MAARFISLAVVLFLLAGCNTGKMRDMIESRTEQTRQNIQEAKQPAPPIAHGPLVVTDSVWAGNQSVRMRRGLPLPARFEDKRGITLVSADALSLNEILSMLSSQTGIPMRAGSESAATTSVVPSSSSMTVTYEGSLSGLLDRVGNHFGMNWRYDGSSISFSRFETRVFVIESLPGTATFSDNMSSDANSSSGSGTTSSSATQSALEQETELEASLNFWDDLSQTVNSMLNGVGTVVVSQSAGTVTVTTSAETMKTIARYIEDENRRLSKQIAINVEVYTVDLNEDDDFSADFSAALKRLAPLSTGYIGPTPFEVVGGGELAVSIIDQRNVGRADYLFTALSEVGNTVRVAQFPMTTLNNRPVSRRIGRDRSYLAQVSISTSQSFQNVTLTPGVVREGFSLQLTPRLLADGRILLQYSLDLTDIIVVRTFESGSNQIQLPETATRVFVQQSMVKSGTTLILAGFDQEQLTQNSRGVGDPFNYLLGGSTTNSNIRQMLFIAITPQELDVPRAEHM